jgi:hypothetical protein
VKLWGWVGLGLALTPPLYIASCTIHDNRVASDFERVTTGMGSTQVITILGSPRSILNCNSPGPFRLRDRPDCAETYVYPSWGAPIIPEAWVVWFDAHGVAIDKYHFVSW